MCLHPCVGPGTIVPTRSPAGGLEGCGGKEAVVAKYEAYCVKCRAKREFEGTEVTLKNGRRAAQG